MNAPEPIVDAPLGCPTVLTSDGKGRWNLAPVVDGLRAVREYWREIHRPEREWGGRELPSREALRSIVTGLCGALFPMRLGPPDLRKEAEDYFVGHALDTALNALLTQIRLELTYTAIRAGRATDDIEPEAVALVREFAAGLPGIRGILDTDVDAAYRGDPAATSVDEVLLCYPGILAIIHYRLANRLYRMGLPLLARIVAENAHSQTGIDIHPGAEIGEGFFIDHGCGVVIGETAIIGNNVRLYQAVTLGAKRFPVDLKGDLQKGIPRHPIVEDDVVIYAGATVLGRIVIGRGSSIGGNVWLTRSVPPGSNITQANTQEEVCPAI
jgi:serine O-acetyltransferase